MRGHGTICPHVWGLLVLAVVAAVLPACILAKAQGQTPKANEKAAETRKVIIRLVRKADGQPIAGAIVVVSSYHYTVGDEFRMEPVAHDEEAEQITDDRGCCLIEAPGGASGVSFLLGREGFAPLLRAVHWKGKTVLQYETAEGWKRQE